MPEVPSNRFRAGTAVAAGAMLVTTLVVGYRQEQSSTLRASTESFCISLTVVGVTAGDPGESYCNPPAVSESSGSSSSSSASSAASTTSSTRSSADEEDTDDGARRGTIEQSTSKMIRLIRNWTRRHTMHAAPREWYQDAVDLLRKRGYIDDASDLRLDADATRAETAKLMALFSGSTLDVPNIPSFDDAIAGLWYVPFIERAAKNSWMLGYDNCYGERPCYFRPSAVITRAEAAAVFVRVFHLQPSYQASSFMDVPDYAWYKAPVQAAADACILRGNGGLVRPDALLTRAELFVMFARALASDTYADDCSDDSVVPSSVPGDMPTAGVFGDAPDGEQCTGFAGMCLLRAAASDVHTFVISPLAGMLSSLDPRALMRVPAGEGAAWMLFIGAPLICLFLCMHFMRPKRMKQGAALVK